MQKIMYNQVHLNQSSLLNGSKVLLLSMVLLMGFSEGIYQAGTQTAIIVATEIGTLTVPIINAIGTGIIEVGSILTNPTKGIYVGIGLAFFVVIIAFILNETKLLTVGDVSHAAVLTGPGATLLGPTLLGLIIAGGVVLALVGLLLHRRGYL